MDNTIKVEIKLVDGEWQWLGKLTPEKLKILTEIATVLSDSCMKLEPVL